MRRGNGLSHRMCETKLYRHMSVGKTWPVTFGPQASLMFSGERFIRPNNGTKRYRNLDGRDVTFERAELRVWGKKWWCYTLAERCAVDQPLLCRPQSTGVKAYR